MKSNTRELTAICVMVLIPKIFLSILPDMISVSGTAGWYVEIATALLCLAGLFPVFGLMKLYPQKNLSEIIRLILGKYAGGAVCLLLFVYFTAHFADLVGEAIQLIKVYHFPKTPFFVFVLGFLIVAWILGQQGWYGMIQTAERFSLLTLVAVVAVLLLGFQQYDARLLFPLGGYLPLRSGIGVLGGLSMYSEAVLILLSLPNRVSRKKAQRALTRGVLIFGGAVTLACLGYLMTFGVHASKGKTVGLLEIVQNVYFNQLFQRTEAIFFLVMVMACCTGICIQMKLLTLSVTELFRIPEHSRLTLPLYGVVFLLTMLRRISGNGESLTVKYLFQYSGGIVFAVVTVLWLIALWKKRRSRNA